jgi:glycosyltransferase involved in cell wall biosynthesis
MSPVLSIITPTYNSMRYFRETANSVLSLKIDLEWILIDSKSIDGTSEFIAQLANTYDWIHPYWNVEPTIHPWNKCVKGLEYANGTYVLFVDSDDTLPSNKAVVEAVANLERSPEIGVAVMQVAYMDEGSRIYKKKVIPFVNYGSEVTGRRIFWTVLLAPTYPMKEGAILIRRSLFNKTGPVVDIDFILRATKHTDFALVPQVGLNYRNVASSSSHMQRRQVRDRFWIALADEHLPNSEYYGLKYFISLYKVALGYGKIAYSHFTAKRI